MSDMDDIKDRLDKIEKLLGDIDKKLSGTGGGATPVASPPGTFLIVPRHDLIVTDPELMNQLRQSEGDFILVAPAKSGRRGSDG